MKSEHVPLENTRKDLFETHRFFWVFWPLKNITHDFSGCDPQLKAVRHEQYLLYVY